MYRWIDKNFYMPIIIEYFNFQKQYETQYGERTVVLMQVGTFYECWSYDPAYCASQEAKIDKKGNIWNEKIGHAVELSVVLNSVLTHENNSEPYTILNPHKIGFPVIAYEKNRDTLLANDYVIIRIDQVKGSKQKLGSVERYVAEVCSPTMQLDNITMTRPTSNIACIYIEYQRGTRNRFDNFVITTGAAVVDIITGQNRVCEFNSKAEDQVCAIQELYRFLITHYPRELIIHINDLPPGLDQHTDDSPNPYIKYLEQVLELRRFDRLTAHVNSIPIEYGKLSYQIEFLNKLFTKQPSMVASSQTKGIQLNVIQKRNEQIIEELGLERMNYGRIAYMSLMQHCHSHNADIITKLSKPDIQWLDDKRHLILTHNAIVQLDLIAIKDNISRLKKKTEIDSLMSVLDNNQTHLGRRALQTILQNPMLDANEIKLYYDMIDEMSIKINDEPLWSVLDKQLKQLPDIGRLQRKLEIKLITPKELAVLYSAYLKIINTYIIILNSKTPVLHGHMLVKDDVNNFNSFLAKYSSIIDFDALQCCYVDISSESDLKWLEFTNCPIKSGFYSDLDEKTKLLTEAENTLQQIINHLNGFLSHTRGKKIEFKSAKKKQGAKKHDPVGTVLTTTISKANELGLAPINTNLCGVLQVQQFTVNERIITSDKITALCDTIDTIKMWMRQKLLCIYDHIIEEMSTKYTFYVPIASLIAKLDLIHSYAKISYQYNYHRPNIIINDAGQSYLEAKEIRHPIIERIIDGAYVTNDIFLGNQEIISDKNLITHEYQNDTNFSVKPNEISTRSNGILLFGVNQTGKSSLAKAVALNIIMAQAGCFVPSHLTYKPYSKIITRITGNDNIFKGQSSFALEMTELRTILRQADKSTLVIGDELAHGTETDSGMAIAVSAITSLIEKQASFIFATHMHDMLKLSYITKIPSEKLKICHLTIDFDDASGNLIYDRKLQNGSGDSIYGLVVAKFLGLPEAFLETANEVLLEITETNKNLLPTNKSRYNQKVYVDVCSVCGTSGTKKQLHTHHLIEQKYANDKQLVEKINISKDGSVVSMGLMHKNAKDNLIIMCQDCHVSLHSNKGELECVATINGKIIRKKSNLI